MRDRLFITALVLVAANAWAAPASRESVETLLEVTRVESTMDTVYGMVEQTMRQGMQQSMQGKPITEEQQRVLDAVPGKFVTIMREEFNWQKMKPLYVDLYRDTFEQEEIDGLIAFYRSPAGQAFVNKMPVVMQKSIALSQSRLQTFLPKMKAAMDHAMAEAGIAR
jgi:hypothetical protein